MNEELVKDATSAKTELKTVASELQDLKGRWVIELCCFALWFLFSSFFFFFKRQGKEVIIDVVVIFIVIIVVVICLLL